MSTTQAVNLYKKFNNREPSKTRVVELALKSPLVDLGRCVAVAYASTKEGSPKHYEHKFRSGRLLCSADGKTLIIHGANIRVTDWIRG